VSALVKLGRLARAGRRAAALGAAIAAGRPLPFSMTFILTHRCNFQCDYCNIPAAAGEEMPAAEFCRAIDELAGAGLSRAGFSGGEALLRPDALDIIRHARARGLTTTLNSNAWLAEPRMDELAAALDLLVLSLDGPEPVHDLVRRRRGSYARVLRALDAARARGLATATITVLTRENLGVVDEVLELARTHGFWAYFQPAYEDCFRHGAGLDPALGPAVYADLAARLDRARDAGAPVGGSPGYTERLARGPAFGDCSRCHAGRYFGTVMPDGAVVPCHLTSGDRPPPNGRALGFARAFLELERPGPGPGCAISPYQEMDLIFSLDPRAVAAALRRLGRVPAQSGPAARS
jgi:MoaA/NifB/PqqE/SkfB family radical SAM enzyme